MVDVQTEILINKPIELVETFTIDPDNATKWYNNIQHVRWLSPKPLRIGSMLEFEAKFLGRTLSYIYKVTDWKQGEKFVMQTEHGPFPMQTTYRFISVENSITRVLLRNNGEPSGFSKFFAPFISLMMRRANNNDLRLLKSVIESIASV